MDAEELTHFVPMLLYSCVKCQAWKNSIFVTTCERITCWNDIVCQSFNWALKKVEKWN